MQQLYATGTFNRTDGVQTPPPGKGLRLPAVTAATGGLKADLLHTVLPHALYTPPTGGWATAMLLAGAGAFIGSHWDVTDDLALRFATEFYAHLLAGDTVAAAVRAARLSIRDEGDPTWLAYTVHADPQARL